MYQLKFIKVFCIVLFMATAASAQKARVYTHPQWSLQSNIYEVNLRQYSKESTFKTFMKEIPRLKQMGVEILWFMPIHPIGVVGRKGSLGSYYAVRDYKGINPEYGNMDDFKEMVKLIHANNMKIIIDWVANHTSPDNVWVSKHPEYYTVNEQGSFVPPVADWTDVIDLNYDNKPMRLAMIDAMKFWLTDCDIDGFRCDVAEMVPTDFWVECRKELDKVKKVFMLAEGGTPEMHEAFDMSYSWKVYHAFKNYFKSMNIDELKAAINSEFTEFDKDDIRMYFTSNHDENTWNATEYEAFGDAAQAVAAVTFTLPGMPLIYSGQEAPCKKRILFFDKDPIDWNGYQLEGFYKKLLSLKRNNKCLEAGKNGGKFEWIETGNKNVLAYKRSTEKNQVITIVNLDKNAADVNIPAIKGLNDFSDNNMKKDTKIALKPFDYKIYTKN